MKKAILYTRVEKGQIENPKNSLADQEKELREFCKKNEIEVLKVIQEYASGDNFNRPEFTNLYLAIRKGELKPDLLLFTSIYVFSENIKDVLTMHHTLLKFGVTTKAIHNLSVVFISTSNK